MHDRVEIYGIWEETPLWCLVFVFPHSGRAHNWTITSERLLTKKKTDLIEAFLVQKHVTRVCFSTYSICLNKL